MAGWGELVGGRLYSIDILWGGRHRGGGGIGKA